MENSPQNNTHQTLWNPTKFENQIGDLGQDVVPEVH